MEDGKSLSLRQDSAEEALDADIHACGGAKAVAFLLWPVAAANNATDSAKKIRRILNREHSQKFSEDEKVLIVKEAARKGSRVYAAFIARLSSAKLQIVSPEEVKAEQIERYEQLVGDLERLLKEIKRSSS